MIMMTIRHEYDLYYAFTQSTPEGLICLKILLAKDAVASEYEAVKNCGLITTLIKGDIFLLTEHKNTSMPSVDEIWTLFRNAKLILEQSVARFEAFKELHDICHQ